MAIFIPAGADFQWSYSNVSATRPTTTGFGTSITPTTLPTMSGWTQVASSANISQDVYGILICINNGATSATTRQIIVDVGVDNAGGTAYVTKIPTLLGGHASTYGLGASGVWYYFPLYIPAGSSVAVRASSTLTTAFNCYVQFYGQPRRPEVVRAGSYVTAFGVNATAGTGTAITLGTTAEGAWTQVGATADKSYWWWQAGYTCADTTMSAAIIHLDMSAGTATNKKILFENQVVQTTAAEQISTVPVFMNAYNNVAVGDNIYIRGQHSGTADTGTSVAAWGLGG